MHDKYTPRDIEQKHYDRWRHLGCFAPAGEGPAYCIMIPPPNVTGTLHMGHAFQDTIMDALTRYHRMRGHKTLWQYGTDHAGIATQMVVERQLNAQGKTRHDLGRDAFEKAVWEWKAQSGGAISSQLAALGGSVDWETERFTMDAELSSAVTRVFVDLYREGLIYRGKRLVNWDPVLLTALSDLEVLSEEENGHLWQFAYPLSDGSGEMVVATTRPETMLGDTAVAVNPDDERYQHLIGKTIDLPLTNRAIPVIADDYVDPEFGTGCVKITPAHDFNDYDIGQRHNLPVINILNPDATLNEAVPSDFQGLDRYDARKKVVADFDALGLLRGIDDHRLMVPRGDRSQAVVEPYLTDQWYVKIEPLAKPAIAAVKNGDIRFVPENWSKTYYEWMHNIQDWCISRQLWWGHRIPAWYDGDGNIFVGNDEADVRAHYALADDITLERDNDVLDTWFSSGLWPFSTLGWPEQTERLATFYPTSVLVTGFDIIFFWVARMIMLGLKFAGDVPFREVYIHGLIRDQDGQKMSKSKGNVLDPLDLINGIDLDGLLEKRLTGLMQPHLAPKIEAATRKQFPDGIPEFGCDALRFTFATLATTGRDIRFELGRIEGNRNFCNKLWNAARFVRLSTSDAVAATPTPSTADRWIRSRLNATTADVHRHFEQYRLDLAAQALYDFVWHAYCDWYLELAKATLNDEAGSDGARAAAQQTLVDVLDAVLRLLHPLMPFITEEIWLSYGPQANDDTATLMTAAFPDSEAANDDPAAEADIEWLQSFTLGVRQIRGEMDISPGKPVPVILGNTANDDRDRLKRLGRLLSRVARIESIDEIADQDLSMAATAFVGELKLLVPLAGLIDIDAERARLARQRDKSAADLAKVQGKLANDKFVANAPADVVSKERERLDSLEKAVADLDEQIARLG
ncbi:MAG: valine--tRNA ligase [Pseudomonadota bacterium]